LEATESNLKNNSKNTENNGNNKNKDKNNDISIPNTGNAQTLISSDLWNDENFDTLSGDVLDLSKNSELVQDSKFLKNITIENIQKNNKSIKVQFPKNTLAKRHLIQT
jgi:hypothetical protein